MFFFFPPDLSGLPLAALFLTVSSLSTEKAVFWAGALSGDIGDDVAFPFSTAQLLFCRFFIGCPSPPSLSCFFPRSTWQAAKETVLVLSPFPGRRRLYMLFPPFSGLSSGISFRPRRRPLRARMQGVAFLPPARPPLSTKVIFFPDNSSLFEDRESDPF